jgi:hypothetical protein
MVSPDGTGGLERVVWVTPYTAETIGQAARRAGQGARLEVIVPRTTGADAVAAVEALFGWLVAKGIAVTVLRDDADS